MNINIIPNNYDILYDTIGKVDDYHEYIMKIYISNSMYNDAYIPYILIY